MSTLRTNRTGAGARINADNIHVYRVIVLLVVAAGLSGVIMSWQGLLHVAAWFELPPQLSWTVAMALDVPIATLALASLAMRSRGRNGAARWFTTVALVFTVLVGTANFLYVADISGLVDYRAWAGAIGKGLAPAITLVMSEVLGLLVTRPKNTVKRRPRKPIKARRTRTAAIPTIPVEVDYASA